jgi:HD-GYP domain-containing protein (c-di-GMP phosphodiesterase class II)
VLTHQERFDGTGYPRGLKGEEIPIGARIFACADALDAMTSDRPYRKALPYERVRQELIDFAGTQFDPLVVEAFLRIAPEDWRRIRDTAERAVLSGAEFGSGIL